ncbi:hypothetical protein HanIR_Chr13g0633111 [Helianthus annuus]|nr:hypothetical protein HanIR_Chr13g0633111 [Helianthus annuus]
MTNRFGKRVFEKVVFIQVVYQRLKLITWSIFLRSEPGFDPDPVKARLRSQYKLRGNLLERESLKMQELGI